MAEEAIQQLLADLDDGEEVRVRLEDGSEHEAVQHGDELVFAETDERVDPERIERVLVDSSLDGPE